MNFKSNDQLPLVSIALPVFNDAENIRRAIESVRNQTYTNWELIVSDNASVDNSWEIIQSYSSSDLRIKAIRQSTNIGIVSNYNFCFNLSQGQYIELFGSDDYFHPECLFKLVDLMNNNPRLSMATCAKNLVYPDGRKEISRPFEGEEIISGEQVGRQFITTLINPISSPVLFRASLKENGFDSKINIFGDVDYWIRLLKFGDLGYLNEALFDYSIREMSETYKSFSDLGYSIDILRILEKHGERFAISHTDQIKIGTKRIQEMFEFARSDRNADFSWSRTDELPYSMSSGYIQPNDETLKDLLKLIYWFVQTQSNVSKELRETKAHVKDLQNQLEIHQTQLENIQASSSWKITRPLRNLLAKLR